MSVGNRAPRSRSRGHAASELEAVRQQLADALETIEAIRTGAVDAFLIKDPDGERVYTLQSADKPYRVLVETMQQGALVCEADGTILFANGRFAELLGTPHQGLPGQPLARYVTVEQRLAFDRLLKHAPEDDATGELLLERADGARIPVHLTMARLPNGGTAAVCVIVTNLTREKEHEAIERERALLQRSGEVLRDADRRKDEFLATLAHELRMPLAPIRSALEVLRLRGAVSPEVEWGQNVIGRQVKRMTRLVDDLLDLGRVTQNQLTLKRTTLDLYDVLRGALETVGPLIEAAGHELLVVVPEGTILLDGDAGRLTQMFANLLTNASNFTSRYGSIEVRGQVEGDMASVTIRDSGDGIPPELLPHIYDMFRRADRSQGHQRSGLGIGLALVKQIAMLHGGTVEVLSEGAGAGCTATVRLPRVTAGWPEPPSTDYATAGKGCGKRILIVDDDVDTADTLAAMLRLHGDEVRAAYGGAMALELGRTFEPQVVLLDIAMPGRDGLETCLAIRAEPWGEGAHVIAITGWGFDEDRALTREAGFDHHLLKPVDPKALSDLLQGLGPRRSGAPWPGLGGNALVPVSG